MSRGSRVAFAVILAGCAGLAAALVTCEGPPPRIREGLIRELTSASLQPFESEPALDRYLDRLGRAHDVVLRAVYDDEPTVLEEAAPSQAAMESAGEAPAGPGSTAQAGILGILTNVQEAGVDEGGIVKAHGDHLVVLRRGRLFTVRIADGEPPAPVASIDVFPPGSEPDGWYDEMLVHDDTVVVLGFSYGMGATEIGLFDLGDDGSIRHRDTFYLRSNDYYSSRNYASRLLGDTLVLYMPYGLLHESWDDRPFMEKTRPGMRRHGAGDDWADIVTATEIYRPIQRTALPVLHTVITCDLATRRFACEARGVVGPSGRSFYVSPRAVYVWVQESVERPTQVERIEAVVYRLPLGGGAPGAVRVVGTPTDQFSFREQDGELAVLVRAEGQGDAMWAPETSAGDIALARIPLSMFTAEVPSLEPSGYTALPRPEGDSLQNRFVGDHVLYGTGGGWLPSGRPVDHVLYVHSLPAARTTEIELPHAVDRIEAMGRAAVAIGPAGSNLHFSAVDLDDAPRLADRYVQRQAAQGETRSHGFFFRGESDVSGVLGLPIRAGGAAGIEQLWHGSAEVLFLRVRDLGFERLGSLAADASAARRDDHCVASCVDWYGNARPIFYRSRVFALLGYELVEGRLEETAVAEVARADFLPR